MAPSHQRSGSPDMDDAPSGWSVRFTADPTNPPAAVAALRSRGVEVDASEVERLRSLTKAVLGRMNDDPNFTAAFFEDPAGALLALDEGQSVRPNRPPEHEFSVLQRKAARVAAARAEVGAWAMQSGIHLHRLIVDPAGALRAALPDAELDLLEEVGAGLHDPPPPARTRRPARKGAAIPPGPSQRGDSL